MTENKKEHSRTFLFWMWTGVTAVIGGVIVVLITVYIITPPPPPHGDSIVVVPKPFELLISGASREDLRAKIRTESSKKMGGRNYFPIHASIDINNWTFSCELEEKKNDYTKIVLLYGPISTGCESCKNTLEKNPGSLVLFQTSDSQYIYNVIAIRE